MAQNQILVAVDDSEPSERVVDYVGRLLRGADVHIRLTHVLPPMPPAMMETRGSNDPQEERREMAELETAQRRWTEKRGEEARPALDRMRQRLVDAGVDAQRIELDQYAPTPEESVAEVLLERAKDCGCGTIVVGLRSLPWFREIFHTHLGERLVRLAHDRSIWIVE